MTNQKYQTCIDACIECATVCNHCAVSCLEEKEVEHLVKCIRLNLECAVICRGAAELMSLDSRYSKEICQLCATICNACAEICEQHANMGMDHCRECAEACNACAKETMEVYQHLASQNKGTNEVYHQFVQQDECAVISRSAAELISLGSAFAKEISRLNAIICDAAAKEFEKHAKMGTEHCSKCAMVAKEANQDLEKPEDKIKEFNPKEVAKKKIKHSSALLAASMYRSPVNAVSSHSYLSGGGDSTGIWSEFQ